MPGTTLCSEPWTLAVGNVVEFDDAEVAMVAYLKARMTARGDSAKVATKRTTKSPARLVRITRTGGGVESRVSDLAQLTFECWDSDDDGAANLARIVRAEVQALDEGYLKWRAEVSGPAYFPHPDTNLSRYQLTQSVAVAGRTV
jgi:hypothetical protein